MAPSPEADYPVLFRRMVVRSVALALEEVQKPGWKPEEQGNRRLLFALDNGLQLPSAWATAFKLLLLLAPRMEQAGLRFEWLDFLARGIACSRIAEAPATTGHLLVAEGVLLQRLGRLAEAQQRLQEAAQLFATLGDRHSEAIALNRLAYTSRLRHHSAEAYASVAAARTLLAEDDVEVGYCHLVLYLLACDRRAMDEATHHAQASLARFHAAGETRMTAMATLNLGTAQMLGANYAAAIGAYQEAGARFDALDDPAHSALAQMNIGCAYLFLAQPAVALPPLLEAEVTFRRLHDLSRLALVYSNLGLAYAELGDWEQAERCLQNAVERFEALGDFPALVDTLLDLVRMYQRSGRPMEAVATARSVQAGLAQIHSPAERAYQASKLEALGIL